MEAYIPLAWRLYKGSSLKSEGGEKVLREKEMTSEAENLRDKAYVESSNL